MQCQRILAFFLWCLSAGYCLAKDESVGAAPSLTIDQPEPSGEQELIIQRDQGLKFDAYSDGRRSVDDLYGQWPTDNGNRLSLSVPMNFERGDLVKLGPRQDNLYQEWLGLIAAEKVHRLRVEAADQDFISPGGYDLLGMECYFTVCKIPHTSCVVGLFPIIGGACSF